MAIIGVVTDDFTGTASAGVFVARSQAKTGLFFDAQKVREFEESDRLDAIYVSSNSRHMPAQQAYDTVAETVGELKKMGVKYFSKKIDTTLRGGIGFEIDAMLDQLDEDMVAVMVTAMPASKRICVGGYSIIDSTILTETFAAKDVKTPVRECFVTKLIGAQSKYPVDLITLNTVLSGKEALREAMLASREKGARIIVIDAITMAHIDVIAQTCVNLKWKVLCVDPGPFTMLRAYRMGLIGEEKPLDNSNVQVKRDKTVLMMVGSANPGTKQQIEILCNSDPLRYHRVSVSPKALIEGGTISNGEIARVVSEVVRLIHAAGEHKPEAIVVETALHGSVLDLKEEDSKHGYPNGTSSMMINAGLADITKQILETVGQEKIAGLLLTGGDVMESISRKIGVVCIQALDNIVAQVDVGRIIGKYDGLPVVVKGGFCGYPEVALDIVERLFLEASR